MSLVSIIYYISLSRHNQVKKLWYLYTLNQHKKYLDKIILILKNEFRMEVELMNILVEEHKKVGASEKEINELISENKQNTSIVEKTIFELITGINPDIFARLYQEGIINIKENIRTIDNIVKDIGIEETVKLFKAKK